MLMASWIDQHCGVAEYLHVQQFLGSWIMRPQIRATGEEGIAEPRRTRHGTTIEETSRKVFATALHRQSAGRDAVG